MFFKRKLRFFQDYSLNKSVLSIFSHVNSPLFVNFLPKWPYADVISYIGLFKFKISLIPLGDRLKFSSIIFLTLSTFSSSPSANLIKIDNGFDTPIAYANCIKHFSETPAATIFFARYLDA